MTEDIQLLRQYAETRDERAFATLVEYTIALVYSAALRQLDGAVHRAQDVTQTVFIELARQAPSLAQRAEIVGWLYTSTHHAAAKLKRTEARRQRREEEARAMHETSSEHVACAEWARLRPVLDDAMHELNAPSRQAILLRFFQNHPFTEIGRQLGLTEDAARMRVDRALEKLHVLLARRGITSTASALGVALANQAAAAAPAGLAASVTTAALTGAAAIGIGSTAVILQFMSVSKIALALAAAGALAVGFAVYQSRKADAARAELVPLQREQAALRERRTALDRELRAAEQAQLATTISTSAAALASEENSDPAPQQRALEKYLAEHPELSRRRQELDMLMIKAAMRPHVGDIGATPQQIDQWLSWAAQRNDATRVAKANGQTPGSGWNTAAKQREIFGDAVGEQFRQYHTSGMAFAIGVVRKLAYDHYFADEPFSADQADQLAALFLTYYDWTRPPHLPSPMWTRDSRMGLIDWDKVLRDAEPILSGRQMDSLRAFAAAGRNFALLASVTKQSSAGAAK